MEEEEEGSSARTDRPTTTTNNKLTDNISPACGIEYIRGMGMQPEVLPGDLLAKRGDLEEEERPHGGRSAGRNGAGDT